MSMRARKPSEYDKDGRMMGDHKDTMSSMFDTRGEQGKSARSELLQSLDTNKKTYDKQLFSDWVIKVYDRCRVSCVVNPSMYNARAAKSSEDLDANMHAALNETDTECGKNCLRKYDKVYKLYANLESSILQGYMEE